MNERFPVAVALVLAALASLPSRCWADLLLAGGGAPGISRFDGASTTLFAADPDPAGDDTSDTKMHGPVALAYDTDGNLLVLNEFSHNVLKFNGTSGAFMTTFIHSADLSGHSISDPDDMEVGPDSNLYIMSHFSDGGINVHKYSSTTGAYIGVAASSLAPVHHQHGLAFGATGDLFQGDVEGRLVERFNGITGASMGTFASNASMYPILDLAFTPTKLYVTCSDAGVARFNALTGASMGYLIPGPGQSYWGVQVEGGNVWLSNTFTGALRRYDATSEALISETFLPGGATDIIAMIPEPSAACLIAPASGLAMLRRRSA